MIRHIKSSTISTEQDWCLESSDRVDNWLASVKLCLQKKPHVSINKPASCLTQILPDSNYVHSLVRKMAGQGEQIPVCKGFVYFVWYHSVESPSMVDPQCDIWYWGSKWNLHTVCWSAVGCEWGTTSVYFGITYVCFIPMRLPVFAVEPQYLLQDFYLCQKYHLKDTYKIFKKIHVGLKFEWGL